MSLGLRDSSAIAPQAKPGKEKFTDVAQAVETRCRRQPAYILEILVKALKLFTYNLRIGVDFGGTIPSERSMRSR